MRHDVAPSANRCHHGTARSPSRRRSISAVVMQTGEQMQRRKVSRPQLAAILLTLAACGDKVCTAAGCFSGLTVHLSAKPSLPYRVEVSTDGGPTPYTVY